MTISKSTEYALLCAAADECRYCPNVYHKLTYLNENNGNLDSPIMFIGEAPGFVKNPAQRLKAFYGNQSGWNFEHLLRHIGLERDSVFVTNALLHTPIAPSKAEYYDYGFIRIRPPSETEIKMCSSFLLTQIAIVNPKIICTIGRAALDACYTALPGFPPINLRQGVAKPVYWNQKVIFPLYHTSPNVTSSIRSLRQMEGDFEVLKELMHTMEPYD